MRLLRLALVGKTWCEIDEQEIKRGGVSYTIDTVRTYARRFPQAELFYLIGADHVSQLPKWREADELARLIQFVVIPRPGDCVAASTGPAPGPAQKLALPSPFRGQRLIGFPLGVSSSQLRERIKAGLSIEHLTPPAVAEAIRNNQLYL